MKLASLAFGVAALGILITAACTSTTAANGDDDDDDDDNSSGSNSSSSGKNTSSSGNNSSNGGSNSSNGGSGSPGGGDSASCKGLAATCGGSKDCCAVANVPGGTFNRSNDAQFPATVSAFDLDVYEVTVGRFRKFVEAGAGTQASPPAAGDGAHPKIPNSGWDASFNAELAADTAALKEALKCDPGYPLWTDAPGAHENKPMNCITWYEALAFCAWDGGRLPTEAEWNFAAAGGSDQRQFPFDGDITAAKANYDCGGAGEGNCTFANILAVGSKSPAGDGKFGHADLAGNQWEYTLDWHQDTYRIQDCKDCADLEPSGNKNFRGGGFPNSRDYQTNDTRLGDVANQRDYDVGVRCARAAK